MIFGDKTLRKISDSTFQQLDDEKEGSRPLEWRRSFNAVTLPLKNLLLNTGCRLHDIEYVWSEEEEPEEPLNLISPDRQNTSSIIADVDLDNFRDSIYFTIKDNEEESLFKLERTTHDIRVSIGPREPSSESDRCKAGIFHGSAFRINFDPGEDYVHFDLSMPKEEFDSIVGTLKSSSDPSLEVRISMLSYTFEVDDFLREPYHPRDFVIDESAYCSIVWLNSSRKIGRHYLNETEEDPEDDWGEPTQNEDLPNEQQRHLEQLEALLLLNKPINNIVNALWVLIIVIGIGIIF